MRVDCVWFAGVASAASNDDDLFKDPTWKDPQLEIGGLASFTPQSSGTHSPQHQ